MTVTDERTTEAMSDRLSEVAEAAGSMAREAADSAGEVAREADRSLRGSSDEVLGIVGAFSVGMAIGMVTTGAPRILVLGALVPAAMVGAIMLERMDRQRPA